jgi:peptidoglycan pentaglycine glycine transferase (the first glycine)
MTYIFTVFADDLPSDWTAWIKKNQRGSIHQIADWKNLQLTIPGRNKVLGFEVTDTNKNILARCLAVQMNTGFRGKKWWYSARGPVFDDKNFAAGEHLILSTQQYLKKETSGMFWRIDPYISATQKKEFSRLMNRKLIPSVQNYQPTDTLMLDLNLDNEALKKQMKREGRRNLNKAEKNNLTYHVITGKSYAEMPESEQNKWLNIYWDLNNQTTGRDGFSGHEKSYYHNFLLKLADYAVLFFVEKDGVFLATALSTFCGDKAIYYFGASSSDKEHRKLCAPYGLQWQMIQYARERGCKTYDFLGIAPEGQPNHSYQGITQFKTRFGGYRETYIHGQELILDSFWYWGYRLIKTLKR